MQVETSRLQSGRKRLSPFPWTNRRLVCADAESRQSLPLCHVGGYVEIGGPVDPGVFERALRQAVAEADRLQLHFIETENCTTAIFRGRNPLNYAVHRRQSRGQSGRGRGGVDTQDILKVDRVSAGDNLFQLGGHSSLTLRVVATVEKRIGYRTGSRALFFQSLRQIAALLGRDWAASGTYNR